MNAWRILLILVTYASPILAGTFTVTNTTDTGPGSLRQAILDASTMGGVTITFNIPGTGVHTVSPLSALPNIAQPVTIDGYTQPGSSQNTNPPTMGDNAVILIELSGAMAPPNSNFSGLHILFALADNCTVRGLAINSFQHDAIDIDSNGNTIEGNFIGTNASGTAALPNGTNGLGAVIFVGASSNNTVGGTTPDARNVISGNIGPGISSQGGAGNVVQGNLIGTDATGSLALGNTGPGILINGSTDVVGGATTDARNVISGNNRGIDVSGGSGNTIQGNFIGTDVTGTTALANPNVGVNLNTGVLNTVIGGLTATPGTPPGNLISGNSGNSGVILGQDASSSIIQGNIIGADITGTQPLGNSPGGITINGHDNTVGGMTTDARNIIAFNGGDTPMCNASLAGIWVHNSGAINNALLGNSIFSNAGLGIDLEFDGDPNCVEPNDEGDSDTGPNNLQNSPLITSVTIPTDNSTVTINGSLNSTASTTFRLEFFSNAAQDNTGYGEGQTFVGTKDVTTDSTGNVSYTATFPLPATNQAAATAQKNFSATATDPAGNTSEFSASFGTELLNISTRLQVLTGDQVLIAGFIITGTGPKKILMRGIGPSLSMQNVPGVLQDPTLELHDINQTIQTNDNWQDTQKAEIEATGIPPTDPRESALIATLDPGAYTGILSGVGGTTGIGLVEVYDLDQSAGSGLANISTRGFVDTGDNVMIGGIIIGPTNTADATVLFRAIGPSLGSQGVQGALQDPMLELHDIQGTTIATNDDWKDTQQTEIEATGIPPTDPRESAILDTLAPGAYTAIVSGKNGTTGVALVEAYHLN